MKCESSTSGALCAFSFRFFFSLGAVFFPAPAVLMKTDDIVLVGGCALS